MWATVIRINSIDELGIGTRTRLWCCCSFSIEKYRIIYFQPARIFQNQTRPGWTKAFNQAVVFDRVAISIQDVEIMFRNLAFSNDIRNFLHIHIFSASCSKDECAWHTSPPTAKCAHVFSSAQFHGSFIRTILVYYYDACDLAIKASNWAGQMEKESESISQTEWNRLLPSNLVAR